MSDYGPDDGIVRGDPVPVYVQLAGILQARIERGDWLPRRALPGRTRLAEEYGVAPLTVRNAVRRLEEQGVVFVVDRRGAFVSDGPKGDG